MFENEKPWRGKWRQKKPWGHKNPRRLEKIFRKIERERRKNEENLGRRVEERVGQIIENLKREGLILQGWIEPPGSKRDRNGIDGVIIFPNGGRVEFQIKRSKRGVEKHQRKYPDIPVIIAREDEGETSLKEKILSLEKFAK